jgi:hypothetical protein
MSFRTTLMRALGFPDVRESSVGWMVLMTIANLTTNPFADSPIGGSAQQFEKSG